jgi:hypothetical protein
MAIGRSLLQLPPPNPDKRSHVGLCLFEFLYLLTKAAQLLFRQVEHMMAGDAAGVASTENLRKLSQGEAKLECSLCKPDALNG